jgi:3-dehydroquinate synthase
MSIYFGNSAFTALQELMKRKSYSKLFIVCDENTHEHCLPFFLQENEFLPPLEILELECGEDTKSLSVLEQLWHSMGDLDADRYSLVLNLGGGVISDLGGFLAATFMRGIDFVNFPTSLLAMVDASVGAKTGINFGQFKNRIGVFAEPQLVGIVPDFLNTLPAEELRSAWAEMLKHALISSPQHFEDISKLDKQQPLPTLEQIKTSIGVKDDIVKKDPRENSVRKYLNFGHTFGHAIESYSHLREEPISHGHAVALGMMIALDISVKQCGFSPEEAKKIKVLLVSVYAWPAFKLEKEALHTLILGDKKNKGNVINMVLLSAIGAPVYNCKVAFETIWKSYQSISNGSH